MLINMSKFHTYRVLSLLSVDPSSTIQLENYPKNDIHMNRTTFEPDKPKNDMNILYREQYFYVN